MATDKQAVKGKSWKEEIARFLESPSREGLRNILKNHVGELSDLDFKENLPEPTKLAKHILAMANTGGGCLVVGVAEGQNKSLEVRGISATKDKTDIIKSIKKYIPNDLLTGVDILDFEFTESEYPSIKGKKFQLVLVEGNPKYLPYLAVNDGDGIRNNAIYVRRGPSTEEASHDEVQRIINARLDTGHSTGAEMNLQDHLGQLKVLYASIPKHHEKTIGPYFELGSALNSVLFGKKEIHENPAYPKEDFDDFIARMIEAKKQRIEVELGIHS